MKLPVRPSASTVFLLIHACILVNCKTTKTKSKQRTTKPNRQETATTWTRRTAQRRRVLAHTSPADKALCWPVNSLPNVCTWFLRLRFHLYHFIAQDPLNRLCVLIPAGTTQGFTLDPRSDLTATEPVDRLAEVRDVSSPGRV